MLKDIKSQNRRERSGPSDEGSSQTNRGDINSSGDVVRLISPPHFETPLNVPPVVKRKVGRPRKEAMSGQVTGGTERTRE